MLDRPIAIESLLAIGYRVQSDRGHMSLDTPTGPSEICVFVGPTRLRRIPDRAHIFAPAALGSVFRAMEAGYRQICLIDGYFGDVPSVWHKEILFALKSGVRVFGASSMGALRAAELHRFGMAGFGWVYRAYRRGILQDDDEVCVLHAVPELHFEALSEAMVNIRYSLRRMSRHGLITRQAELRIAAFLKDVHFSKRDGSAIRHAFEREFGSAGANKLALYETTKVDIKSLDAELMLSAVLSGGAPERNDEWELPITNHWLSQFLIQIGDIPQICKWHPVYERRH